MSVNHRARSGGIIEISFRVSLTIKFAVLSLESLHRGDSNEYTQQTIINIKKTMSTAMGIFVRDSRMSSK